MNFDQVFELINNSSSLKGKTIGLTGDLGAGKTWLVENLLLRLSNEFKDQVSSPTFTYCNIYENQDLLVHHYDLYRIEEEEALMDIGFYESLDNEDILCLVEWIDHFPDLDRFCDLIIHIDHNIPGKPEYSLISSK